MRHKSTRAALAASAAALLSLGACAQTQPEISAATAVAPREAANPFFQDWSSQPFAAPPFNAITTTHYREAYQRGMAENAAEIDTIANQRAAPSFDNTIVAMERPGELLTRVDNVFGNLSATDSTDALREIQQEMAPLLARHNSQILLNQALFARVRAVYEARATSGLTPEQQRVTELYHQSFQRAGAALPEAARARLAAITEELSTLSTQFGQNMLADTADWTMRLETETDFAGLPDSVRAAAFASGTDLGQEGAALITLQRSSVEPFLQYSSRRDLRERAFRAWAARGANANAYDNRGIAQRILALRAEQARLLGFETYAHYQLDNRMAQTPARAIALMDRVWPQAVAAANAERARLQAMVDAEGGGFQIAPWDWRYYAERVRLADYDLNDAELRPYLQLDRMVEGMFYTANRLFGLTFTPRDDIQTYHPEVRAYDVRDASGAHVGVYFADFFARPSKQSGAWMNSFRIQSRVDGDVTPIIVNVLNLSRGAPGEPVLLSWNDADTLFHEFGHALHGLLSNVTYPRVAGTAVFRDYVEFPSQVYENWLGTDEILQRFAVHYQTGAPIPAELRQRLRAAQTFNEGFSTVEYLASAMIDMDLHLANPEGLDIPAAEAATLARIGMPAGIIARHRPTHFSHIFSGGYAAGYYGYIWAEVFGADGFAAFTEAGDPFDPVVAERLRTYVFSAGNLRDPSEAYRAYRGRDAEIGPLLRLRGFE